MQNQFTMKTTIFSRALLVATALFISAGICFGQDDPPEQMVGTWIKVIDMQTLTLTLSSDKKSQVEFTGDDVIDVYGRYELYETQITFTDEGGDYAADVQGVYDFKLGDNTLTFTKVEDPVDGRSMLLEGTWSKSAEKDK